VNPIPMNLRIVFPLLGTHPGITFRILLGEKNIDDFMVQNRSVNFRFSTFSVTSLGLSTIEVSFPWPRLPDPQEKILSLSLTVNEPK